MKKRNVSRIIALLLAAVVFFAFASDAVLKDNISAAGLRPTWIKQDAYDDLYVYKYKDRDFYYADSYFAQSGYVYNPHLATISEYATERSGDFAGIKDDATEEEIKQWCLDQPSELRAFWDTIGFTDFDCNSDYTRRSSFYTIGVGVAKRKISVGSEDYTVLAVCPRSASYFREWGNNVWLGDGTRSDYMHEGWYNAAKNLIEYVGKYIETHSVSGKVKLWMMGFSRGGATTNIAAGLIDNMIDSGKPLFGDEVTITLDDVYAYTFEAPQGANVHSKTVKAPKDKLYNNIWNIVNPLDLVPKLAMSEYGFTRFGTDRYITTKFYDPANYEKNRNTFKKLYSSIGGNLDEYNAETFDMYGMTIGDAAKILGTFGVAKAFGSNFINKDDTKRNYDANFVCMLLLEEATKNIGSREDYCKKLQSPLSSLLVIFSDDQNQELVKNKDKAISDFVKSLLFTCIVALSAGTATAVSGIKEQYKKAGSNPLLGALDDIIIPLIGVVGSTYWNRPNELISVGKQVDNVFKNHEFDVTLAHIMAQDSYYIDAYNSKCDDESEYISVVPFRDTADYGRMTFKCFNDLALRVNGIRVANVDGHIWGKSDVTECAPGYAVGYYSYATEEWMELFFPVNQTVDLSVKDYSKKLRHVVEYWAYYQYFALDNSGTIKRQIDSIWDKCWFNSDRYYRTITARK